MMNVIMEKEDLFQQYLSKTEQAVAATDYERTNELVEQRDVLMACVNELDKRAGTVVTSDAIKQSIYQIQQLDKRLMAKLYKYKQEAQEKIELFNKGKKLKNHYQAAYQSSEGYFYDKRK
jgi:hypothetical protein